jgi:hypothetical protein
VNKVSCDTQLRIADCGLPRIRERRRLAGEQGRRSSIVVDGSARGAILLEVVLALVLFAAAATIVGVALNAAMGSVDRLRLGAQAADLSVTVFSELQLGIRSVAEAGGATAQNQGTNAWTVEIIAQPWGQIGTTVGTEESALSDVEVVLRHESGFIHRGRQIMKLGSTSGDSSVVKKAVKSGGLVTR